MSQIIGSTYEIIGKLGAGGGGNVYLAWHLRLKKKVVLKIDKRKLSTRQEFLRREVDVLKELNHPYIPKVYDFFVEGEAVYTVIEYIEGESLDKALKRGERFSQAQVVRWAVQLLDALCYLHTPTHGTPPKGYVHSDIKPANLMRTQDDNICLIDFNIALALGEEGVIGCSVGYASPEHYGFDFSSRYDEENSSRAEGRSGRRYHRQGKEGKSTGRQTGENAWIKEDTDITLTRASEDVSEDEAVTLTMVDSGGISSMQGASGIHGLSSVWNSSDISDSSSISRKRLVMPDVRSDIYSVGATLYHLLSGVRPSKDATEVVPLSEKLANPQIVRIISKAMLPNPGFRYQTADEMKQAFLNLRKDDPRMRRWRKRRRAAAILFPTVFLMGGITAFAGLKRMQSMEKWLKLTEYAQTALEHGDVEEAREYVRTVLAESSDQFLPEHVPGIQRALTDAAGVYDLSDGYKIYKTTELPSAPLYMVIAPDGESASALCGQNVVIFNTKSGDIMAELPVEPSAISQIRYLDGNTILYAGEGGIRAYDIREENELWTGDIATSICISEDRETAAGIYEGDTYATVYDTKTGKVRCKVDFAGKSQNIGIKDNLFALNRDGSQLAVSFRDGSLGIYDLTRAEGETKAGEDECAVFYSDSGYEHYEGGFFGEYLAFAAYGQGGSIFSVIDAVKGEEAGGFQADTDIRVQADESGIYVGADNVLVKMDPVTGEQTPLAAADENILRFVVKDMYTMAATEKEVCFFDKNARMTSHNKKEYASDLIGLSGDMAVVGSMDRPVVRIMWYEEHPDAEVFSYDPDYQHDEARVSGDGKTAMLYSYKQFRIYEKGGSLIKEVDIPDPDHVVDQQFIRAKEESYLEVTYDDGRASAYSAGDGELIYEKADGGKSKEKLGAESNGDLDEEFIIDRFRIESPLHGTPVVYDKKTGKEIARLEEDAYLTDVVKAGDYLAARYTEVNGGCFGELLNSEFEVAARLPYLSDVIDENLIFDYPTGSIRESRIYDIEELAGMIED